MSNSTMPLEQVKANCSVFYGVPVSFLGEEQEGVAAFTTDRRRALAAMNKLVRTEIGGGERLPDLYDVSSLSRSSVLAHDRCGCEHPDPTQCSGDTNGDVTCCPVIEATDDYDAQVDDHDCPHYGLPPCTEDLYAWVTEKVEDGTTGALPLFQVYQ